MDQGRLGNVTGAGFNRSEELTLELSQKEEERDQQGLLGERGYLATSTGKGLAYCEKHREALETGAQVDYKKDCYRDRVRVFW